LPYFLFNGIKTGINNTSDIIEKAIPPITPVAKAYQKTSSFPSIKKGTSPSTVDIIVNTVGITANLP